MSAHLGLRVDTLVLHRVVAKLGDLRALLPQAFGPEAKPKKGPQPGRNPPRPRSTPRRTRAQVTAMVLEIRAKLSTPEYAKHGGKARLAREYGVSDGYLSTLLDRL